MAESVSACWFIFPRKDGSTILATGTSDNLPKLTEYLGKHWKLKGSCLSWNFGVWRSLGFPVCLFNSQYVFPQGKVQLPGTRPAGWGYFGVKNGKSATESSFIKVSEWHYRTELTWCFFFLTAIFSSVWGIFYCLLDPFLCCWMWHVEYFQENKVPHGQT